MDLHLSYAIADSVKIDGDSSIKGTITAVMARGLQGNQVSYEVSYIHCGNSHSVWIESWRVSPWEE